MKRNQKLNATSSPAVKAARERASQREQALGLAPGALGGPTELIRWEDDTWNLNIADLPAEGHRLSTELPSDVVAQLLQTDDPKELNWRPSKAMAVDLHLVPQMECIGLRGRFDLLAHHDCVRCLAAVPFELPIEINVKLVEGDPNTDFQGSLDLDPQQISEMTGDISDLTAVYQEDEDLVLYQNGIIDLKSLLREQIYLELPMNPKCSDGSGASDDKCGELLGKVLENQKKEPDPRWAALAELSKKIEPTS